eukprot:Phypoly_transcript_02256.p1 GENE.Phypoly_transcript_02256~~Phypoly_transcript_02256.p1  ORF type:complete len:947 (+),score=114.19 Phypoly_transcript_02256:323-2842(+)
MSQDQSHYGFLHLFSHGGAFLLEVTVVQDIEKALDDTKNGRDSLISELAYAITRLDRDMWEDTPVQHDVILCLPATPRTDTIPEQKTELPDLPTLPTTIELVIPFIDCVNSLTQKNAIPFVDCVNEVAQKNETLKIAEHEIRLDLLVPDLSCCNEIYRSDLTAIKEIGRGGYGVVYKAILNDPSTNFTNVPVAIKEMKQDVEEESTKSLIKIYEFQHEMLIMSKVTHKNLVQIFGVLNSPLSLVMEFVPHGDLHKLLGDTTKLTGLTMKWRLKMAIDIASGMSHLHKQTPPICHSDLRAPNIFVASLDEDAAVVGKVADFGLAQQVFPFSVKVLGNIAETAPETWGDEGMTKGATYDERSDVFSFAILLWRLFSDGFPEDQCGSSSSSPSSRTSSSSSLSSVLSSVPPSLLESRANECDPYGHLRDKKGQLNMWTLRNKIREGERPIIKNTCPLVIKKLIEDCWQFDPTHRPFFSLIKLRLHFFYNFLYGDDKIRPHETHTKRDSVPPPLQNNNPPRNICSQPNFSLENWLPKPQLDCAIVSLLMVEDFLWAGTNTGAILIFNLQTAKLDSSISLQNSKGRVSLVYSGQTCIWASCETEKIVMIHAKTRYKAVEIDNEYPVICMAISYHHAGPSTPVVWVSDARGFVSLWDLTTLQKFCKFQVIPEDFPPVVRSMSVMHEHIWMAAGSYIVVIETQTLHKIVQPTSAARINCITTVPKAQQAWTCSKDGTIAMWDLQDDETTNTQSIVKLKAITRDTEVKFVQALTATAPPFSCGQVISGDFNGKLTLWNNETFEIPVELPMPPESSMHALQCGLDTGECGLWIGTMNPSYSLMRYKMC